MPSGPLLKKKAPAPYWQNEAKEHFPNKIGKKISKPRKTISTSIKRFMKLRYILFHIFYRYNLRMPSLNYWNKFSKAYYLSSILFIKPAIAATFSFFVKHLPQSYAATKCANSDSSDAIHNKGVPTARANCMFY